jgi:hypothetical protein
VFAALFRLGSVRVLGLGGLSLPLSSSSVSSGSGVAFGGSVLLLTQSIAAAAYL